jgi:alkylation response protein AidB-like acyl-CoA dehydrogenase
MNVSVLPIGIAVNPQSFPDTFRQSMRLTSNILYDAAQSADAEASIARNSLDLLHTSGLAIAPFDESLGGQNLPKLANIQYLVDALRELGSADLSIGRLYEGHVNAVDLVSRYGSMIQVRSLAEAVAGGGLSGVWGAEDLKGLHAHRTPDGWQLTGKKILASGAGLLKHPLVSATTKDGQVLFLLTLAPGERADVSGWTAQGMRSSATGSVDLTGMVISAEQLIGKPGDFMRQPNFSGGAWRFCAVHLGAMERLLDLFREHLADRVRTEGSGFPSGSVCARIGS